MAKLPKQKQNENFTFFIFRNEFPIVLFVALFHLFLTYMYTNNPFFTMNDMGKATMKLSISLLTYGVFLIIYGPIMNLLLTSKINSDINYMKYGDTTEKENTEFLRRILHFPIYKMIEIYTMFALPSVLISVYFHIALIKPIYDTLIYLCLSLLTIYFGSYLCYYGCDSYVSEKASLFTSGGINEEEVKKSKYFGLPLRAQLFQFLALPILFTGGIFILLGIKQIIEESRTFIFMAGTISYCLIIIFFITLCYFNRISSYVSKMKKALTSMNKENILNITEPFPTDFSNHISYSLFLINKTISIFQELIYNYSKSNTEIQKISLDLYNVSNQTNSTVIEQTSSVEEINATIQNINNLSESIEKKVEEVINIADKTLISVNENSQSLNANLKIMEEITQENDKTISGIENLYSKINSLWEIVNLIDSVTEQTKIIAFNAELEAESLYEKNDRLNNVSSQIRNLANKTGEITRDIKEQLRAIQNSSNTLIQTSKICKNKINEGNTLSLQLNKKFEGITKSAKETADNAGNIKYALYAQSASMASIGEALAEVNAGARDFEESTRTISETISTLQENSKHLEKISN